MTYPRPMQRDQHTALRALISHDRLPGQPTVSRGALRQALAGRSPIDGGWWDELTDLHTEVLPTGDGTLAGAVSWGYRGETAVLTWLHAREDPEIVAAVLEHALAAHPGRWAAFEFATALTLGVEALPIGHRPITATALEARGFVGHDLWRYMHRPLTDLPPRPDLTFEVRPGRLDGWKLATPDGAGQIELTGPVAGTAMIGWLEVDPAARGRGLGAALLTAGLWHLAEHSANDAVLYVDDDAPGSDRDRRAANRLYDRAGFVEVDRLHSYTRP